MAITVINDNTNVKTRLQAESTDTKPSVYAAGSTLYEPDTGRKFVYDGSDWKGENVQTGAVIGTASFTMSAGRTAGDSVSATFTMPVGGTFGTVAIINNNPYTVDITCSLYAQETLGTASYSCLIASLSMVKSTSQIQQISGAFIGTNLLMQLSPDAAVGQTATATVKIRSVRGEY